MKSIKIDEISQRVRQRWNQTKQMKSTKKHEINQNTGNKPK